MSDDSPLLSPTRANTGGVIGFWGYTVALELKTIPDPSSLVLASLGLAALARVRRARA